MIGTNNLNLNAESIALDRIPEIKRTQRILIFLLYVVFSIYALSFMIIIYSLSMNYGTNTYEPILVILWILFFSIGIFLAHRYYPKGLFIFAWLGIANAVLTCILIVFVTVGIVIMTSQSSKPTIDISFSMIPIVTHLIIVMFDTVIVLFAFKLSFLIRKYSRSSQRERINVMNRS